LLGACLAIAWQSGSGRAIAEPSPAAAAAALCLLVFGVTALLALCAWLGTGTSHTGREAAAA
jgi:hypothetical protein